MGRIVQAATQGRLPCSSTLKNARNDLIKLMTSPPDWFYLDHHPYILLYFWGNFPGFTNCLHVTKAWYHHKVLQDQDAGLELAAHNLPLYHSTYHFYYSMTLVCELAGIK